MKNQHIRVFVVPYCGDTPCTDDGADADALIVRRITVDGKDLAFTKAQINADANGILSLHVEFVPGKLEVLQMLDPWAEQR
jgi:hypothetical protein